ncbi:MAG TPA: glycosyltransferase [Thermoleophilaceae bacterium]
MSAVFPPTAPAARELLDPSAAPPSALGPHGEGLAIVTEQVAEFGGVERVLASLAARYPAAPIVATRFEPASGFPGDDCQERIARRVAEQANGSGPLPTAAVRLVGRPGRRRRHFLFPLYARDVRSAPLDGARVVLSLGGNGWSNAAAVPRGARHVAYVGGPPRPLYGHFREYTREYAPHLRPLLLAAVPALRAHYRRLLAVPAAVAANSRASADGLRRLLRRHVDVIYPPVRTEFFTPAPSERRHFLVVSRLRPHKRVDVVLDAFRELGEPLVVAGEGPWREKLERGAPPNVRFVGHVGDGELRELYRSSRAIVSASVEEFGLCLAEALAAGVPVVAPRAGGSGEIVVDGENGVALESIDPVSVAGAVRRLERMPIDPATCRASAERFSEERFAVEIDRLIGG